MLDKLFDKLPYEQLEKIKFTHLLAGAAGVGLLLVVIYIFTLYDSGREATAALVAKKATMENKLRANQSLVAQSGAISNELADYVHRLAEVKKLMPLASEMPRLLREISNTEKELTLETLQFQVEEGKVRDYYKEIPIIIQLRGGYWNAVGFFDKLQNLLQTVTFSDLKMELPDAKNKGDGGILTRITAKTFAYIDGSENHAAPVAPAPPPAPGAQPKPATPPEKK